MILSAGKITSMTGNAGKAVLILVFLAFFLRPSGSFSQNEASLGLAENTLKVFRDSARTAETDSLRIMLGKSFDQEMLRVFSLPGSFSYPFDSLGSISMLRSPDDDFRICTWNIPLLNHHFIYSGLIQWNDKKHPGRNPQLLRDIGDSISDPDSVILTGGNWFGAIYYRIIPEKYNGKPIYTLLGWRGTDKSITRKVIDILSVNESGMITFGKRIFPGYRNGNNDRVIFSFSAETSMTVRYDEQYIVTSKKWNAKSKSWDIKKKKTFLIVCDRLIPLEAGLEGQYQFYVPASDIYDGFVFGKDGWKFIQEIQAENP